MLLDELRWIVLERELGAKLRVLSHAQLTSFARTVREHMPELRRWSVTLDSKDVAVALAVHRLRERAVLERFRNGRSPTAFYRQTIERYGYRIVHYFHKVDLHATSGGPLLESVTIPWSHDAIVVGAGHAWSRAEVLSSATWTVVTGG